MKLNTRETKVQISLTLRRNIMNMPTLKMFYWHWEVLYSLVLLTYRIVEEQNNEKNYVPCIRSVFKSRICTGKI